MSEQDEYDKIQNECIQLENDMEFMKKRANKVKNLFYFKSKPYISVYVL